MRGAVYNLVDEKLKDAIDEYKVINNIKRLSKDKREELTNTFESNSELYKVLKQL